MPTVRTPEAPCCHSPSRGARCCLPPWEMGSAPPTTIDFGAIFPFTCVPAYSFPCLRFAAAVTERHARLGTRLLARPCRGCHFRRLCLTSFQGATPTDPDVRVLPHPAPRRMASLRARGRVDGRHSRKRISREEAEKPLPGHRFLLRPTVEPRLPDVDDMKAARRQARGVPRNPVVGTVPRSFDTNIRCCSATDAWRCTPHPRFMAVRVRRRRSLAVFRLSTQLPVLESPQ